MLPLKTRARRNFDPSEWLDHDIIISVDLHNESQDTFEFERLFLDLGHFSIFSYESVSGQTRVTFASPKTMRKETISPMIRLRLVRLTVDEKSPRPVREKLAALPSAALSPPSLMSLTKTFP